MKHLSTIAFLMIFAAACASQEKTADDASDVDNFDQPPEETGAPRAAVPEGAPAKCVDENDEPIECEDNSECCDGFECGYDPEGSTRIKTCVWAG